jgi:alpha-tubulin suppressor-like RCC1 family protein
MSTPPLRWAVLALALAAGCYTPDLGECAVACGAPPDVCPLGMRCGADAHCHRPGAPASCPAPDLAVTLDLAVPPDPPRACTVDADCPGGRCDCAGCSVPDARCDVSGRRYTGSTGLGGTCVPGPVDLSTTVDTTCMVRTDGRVYCWGDDERGQLGNPSVTTTCILGFGTVRCSRVPVPVLDASGQPLTGASRVVTTAFSACALMKDATVRCWGDRSLGLLGDGALPTDAGAPAAPVAVTGLPPVARLFAGYVNVCALTTQGELYCWGDNRWGQLGSNGGGTVSASPVLMPLPPGTINDVAVGGAHVYVAIGRSAYAVGRNNLNQLGMGGMGDSLPHPMPSAVLSGPGPSGCVPITTTEGVAAGNHYGCAVTSDPTNGRRALCWGENDQGAIGDGTVNITAWCGHQVANLDLSLGVAALGLGTAHTCLLINNGDLWCWGSNAYSQIYSSVKANEPMPVKLMSKVSRVFVGFDHTCVFTDPDQVLCWGGNDFGMLGNGSVARATAPTRIVCAAE